VLLNTLSDASAFVGQQADMAPRKLAELTSAVKVLQRVKARGTQLGGSQLDDSNQCGILLKRDKGRMEFDTAAMVPSPRRLPHRF
jgi:hypothetical protein